MKFLLPNGNLGLSDWRRAQGMAGASRLYSHFSLRMEGRQAELSLQLQGVVTLFSCSPVHFSFGSSGRPAQVWGMVAARWIAGWLRCGRWMSRGCAMVPDSIKGGTTAKFLNSWKDRFYLWNHTCLWLSLRLAKGVSCSTARVRWLDVLERRCKSHSSKQELSHTAGEVNSLAEVCLQEWALVPNTTLWKVALVKWELVPGVGQSWAEETGSAGCLEVKCRLDWNVYWFLILCCIQWFSGLISHVPFFRLKIFYQVAEKLKEKKELMYV